MTRRTPSKKIAMPPIYPFALLSRQCALSVLACLALAVTFDPVHAQTQSARYTHNGSDMVVAQTDGTVRITYATPRSGLRAEGVGPGTELFSGTLQNGYLSGMARIFRAGCGRLDYFVYGDFTLGQAFRLSGAAPVLAPQGCAVVNNVHDGPNANLVFHAVLQQSPPPSGIPQGQGTRLCVTGVGAGSALNLRVGPDTGYGVIGRIPPGHCDAVAGPVTAHGWQSVRWQGQAGWASLRYLSAAR